ncbi:MAG: amino acid adenylation domain-containing protein [Candidatus Aminicenantes bacterium]|nr:amino acid adenylation domain-containing protein [Candidatus Aminicenantes bacterium]
MNIKDLVLNRKVWSTPGELLQAEEMLKEHYRLQTGQFVSKTQTNEFGLFAYSNATVDFVWNHAAVFPGSETRLPECIGKIETFALEHRRYPSVYLVAESPGFEEAAAFLSKAGYELNRAETWMGYPHEDPPPAAEVPIEMKPVQSSVELDHFVEIFNESFTSRRVYMGDALTSQFYGEMARNVTHFVGYLHEAPIGICTMIPGREDFCGLYSLGVTVKQRKRGYGASLVTDLIKAAMKTGQRKMFFQADFYARPEQIYRRLGSVALFHRACFVRSDAVIPAHEAEPFWRSNLAGIDVPTMLPGEADRTVELSREEDIVGVECREIPAALVTAAGAFTEKCGITMETLLTGAWALLLSRYCREEKVLFAMEFSRQGEGLYPAPLTVTPSSALTPWLQSIAELRSKIEGYAALPMLDIQEWSSVPVEHRLFNILLKFTSGPKTGVIEEGRIYPLVCIFSRQKAHIEINYNREFFTGDAIQRLTGHLLHLFEEITRKENPLLGDLDIVTEAEKRRILFDFNDTVTGYPREETLPRLFEEQVEKAPGKVALVGVSSGDGSSSTGRRVSLTYRRLNRESDRLARVLVEKGVRTGDIVAFMAERSIEMIVGILSILKAGAAYLPIEIDFPPERIRCMLVDSSTKLLLAAPGLSAQVEKLKSSEVETVFFNTPVEIEAEGFHVSSAVAPGSSANLAYVIYTSGTSGKPKGVLTRHYNVVRVVKDTNYIEIKSADRLLQLSNYAFDGSVFDIYGALLNGAALVLIDRPRAAAVDRLASLIKREKVTVFFVTTALFNVLVDLQLDCFANVGKVLFGGERVSVEHARKALEYMGKDRIIHVYGPTETTVYATYYVINSIAGSAVTIPIGKPIANTSLYILDKSLKPVPLGVSGEIYIGGDGNARGYLNSPGLTAEKFVRFDSSYSPGRQSPVTLHRTGEGAAHPASERQTGQSSAITGRQAPVTLYRTGDLARWLPEGEIEFLGRIDHQVKIRGFRIELGEIEARLLEHEKIKEAVVLDKILNKEKYLCAYIVAHSSGTEVQIAELREVLSRVLPDYMIPTYFVFLDRIPLTPNGKVDRKLLPEPEILRKREYTAPGSEIEEKLAVLWSQVLNIAAEIGIDDNFFELGGHSLKGTILIARVHKEFNVKLELAEIFDYPTIREAGRYIKEAVKMKYVSIEKAEKKSYYVLSFNQERLWFIHRRDPRSTAFNMPGVVDLPHPVDCPALRKAVEDIIQRHESLRTEFKMIDDKPVQFIMAGIKSPFREVDISHLGEAERNGEWERIFKKETGRVFSLEKAPLFHTLSVKLAADNYKLIYAMHHIISDGWSMEIFKKELIYLYESYRSGKPGRLEPLSLHYKDFAQWQVRRAAGGAESEESFRFWASKVEGGISRLTLPTKIGGDSRDLSGASYRVLIGEELKENLKKLGESQNTTLFMVMFTAFIMTLSRYAGRKDIVCSIINAGREHDSLYPIIGFFVNSVLFKTQIGENETFAGLLQRVHEDVLVCFKHQGYPLEKVFREKKMRYPDIPAAFNMANMQAAAGKAEPFSSYHTEHFQDVKFDLEPYVGEYGNGIDTLWVYKKALLSAVTVEHFVGDYIKLLEFAVAHPGKNYREFKTAGKKRKFKRNRG